MTSPTPSLDTLVSTVARAYMHCPPSIAKIIIEACAALEEEHDLLQAEREKLKRVLQATEEVASTAIKERDALQAELEAVQVSVEHIARCQRSQFEELNEKLSRFKASTVAYQITRWAEANYSNSHEAQAVVEGCYETEELEEFGSLEAFKKHAGIRDDYRKDIINA